MAKQDIGKGIAIGIGLFVAYKLFIHKGRRYPASIVDSPQFNERPVPITRRDYYGQVT